MNTKSRPFDPTGKTPKQIKAHGYYVKNMEKAKAYQKVWGQKQKESRRRARVAISTKKGRRQVFEATAKLAKNRFTVSQFQALDAIKIAKLDINKVVIARVK